MNAADESPQLGHTDVDREALDAEGVAIAVLATELGSEVDDISATGAPVNGWRVLKRHANGSVLIGAPTDSGNQNWRVAHVQTKAADAAIQVLPDVVTLRPSRSERRRGLTMRWPQMVVTGEVTDDFFIDIVNVGDTRWIPDGDGFQVVGVFTEPGVTKFSFGWADSGQQRAVPLDPGDYVRVPVSINPAIWADLEAGERDLHAILTGLDLRADQPLRLDVTAEQIARQKSRSPRHTVDPEQHRRRLDAQISQTRTMIAAAASLTAIAEAVTTAETDSQAIGRIASLLECGNDDAQAVYSSPLRELRTGNTQTLENRIVELTRFRDTL